MQVTASSKKQAKSISKRSLDAEHEIIPPLARHSHASSSFWLTFAKCFLLRNIFTRRELGKVEAECGGVWYPGAQVTCDPILCGFCLMLIASRFNSVIHKYFVWLSTDFVFSKIVIFAILCAITFCNDNWVKLSRSMRQIDGEMSHVSLSFFNLTMQ